MGEVGMMSNQLPDEAEAGYDEIVDALMKDFHMPEYYAERVIACIRGAIEIYELEQARR